MATSYDIVGIQGSSISLRFTTRDSAGNNINLTNYVLSGYARNKYTDTSPLLNLNPTYYSQVSGIVDIFVSGSQTANLPVTVLSYDVEAFHPSSGIVIKISKGKMLIDPEATY